MSENKSNKNKQIEALLAAIDAGDERAMAELVDLVYPELKRLAHFQLAGERPDHTLNTTAIVHEAYLRLAGQDKSWNNRGHFLRAAATVMRHLLVDHARKRNAAKRGDGVRAMTMDENRVTGDDDMLAVLELNNAMNDIASLNPRLEHAIECRYFAGLSIEDTAEALGVGVRTIERDLQQARGYLRRAMESKQA